MKISIFGVGYVGAVSSACLASLGHEVVAVDVSPEKVALIEAGRSPIVEDEVDRLMAEAVQSGRLSATMDVAAAVAALTGDQSFLGDRAAAFQKRRDLVLAGLGEIKGMTCPKPEGAFYIYASFASLIGRKTPGGAVLGDDTAVATYLLNEGRVAAVPGAAYGLSPYFRISTATGEAVLEEAVARIQAAVAQVG